MAGMARGSRWVGWVLPGAARGLAIFLGGFSLLNIVGDLRTPGFDANEWWINLRAVPREAGLGFLAMAGVVLAVHGVRPMRAGGMRRVVQGVVVGLMVVVVANIVSFVRVAMSGWVQHVFPIPFSAFIAGALVLILADTLRGDGGTRRVGTPLNEWVKVGVVFLACLFVFPLLQMICFGKTDYRRHADAIVVFGARAYADGTPSQALADRTRTACKLYQQGYARTLIFSGGPGDGAVHEVESMRRFAVAMGVPERAILLDYNGFNTEHTVDNTAAMFRDRHIATVMAVSHFYHLPRVKMTYRRAGWEVYTVPAEEAWPLSSIRTLMTREIVALWAYYLRPLGDVTR